MPDMASKLQSHGLLVGKTIEAMHYPILNLNLQHRIDGLFRTFVEASSGGVVSFPMYRFQRYTVGNAVNPARHLRCEAKFVGVAPDHHKRVVDDLLNDYVASRKSG